LTRFVVIVSQIRGHFIAVRSSIWQKPCQIENPLVKPLSWDENVNGGMHLNHIDQTLEERFTVFCILILIGCAFLVGAFLAILLLKVLLDLAEFVLTAVLATVILIFHHPALGIAFAFALVAFVILIARWAGGA
jgi:hypothetical protein